MNLNNTIFYIINTIYILVPYKSMFHQKESQSSEEMFLLTQ